MELLPRKGFFDTSAFLCDSCFLCVAMAFENAKPFLVASVSPGPAQALHVETLSTVKK